MKNFKYKIVDTKNQVRSGVIEGEDLQKVASTLLEQGFTILDLRPQKFDFQSFKNINIGGVPFKEKVIFIRQLSFMINAGLPITQAIEIAQNQIKNFKFKNVVGEVLKDVQSGVAFSKAMDKHPKVFDDIIRNLIRAGEESGKIDMILERVADDMERKQEFNSKVKGALIYPAVILVAIVAVVALLLVFMIPQMTKLFEDKGAQLPTATKIIISASDFLRGLGGVLTLVVLIAAIASFIYYRKTESGRVVTDGMFLKMPIFGVLINKSQVASFCRTFSMLLTSGVPILDSLKLVAASTTNAVFKNTILDARNKVEKGVPLSQPISASKAFPSLVGNMMRVGEETGQLDMVIEKVGTQYAREVNQMADNLTKLMEPLILIVMGIVIGILAIAIYLPIFNLGSVVSGIN